MFYLMYIAMRAQPVGRSRIQSQPIIIAQCMPLSQPCNTFYYYYYLPIVKRLVTPNGVSQH